MPPSLSTNARGVCRPGVYGHRRAEVTVDQLEEAAIYGSASLFERPRKPGVPVSGEERLQGSVFPPNAEHVALAARGSMLSQLDPFGSQRQQLAGRIGNVFDQVENR